MRLAMRGVTEQNQWGALFAYALEAPTKTKPWLGDNFHAGLRLSVLLSLPRHLSHHHSITVCLHDLRSWIKGGSGRSLGSSVSPTLALFSPSHCLPPTTPPSTHIHFPTHFMGVYVTSYCDLSLADTMTLCGFTIRCDMLYMSAGTLTELRL